LCTRRLMPSLQRAIAFRWGIISQPDAGGASGAVGGRMVALCCGDGSHQASFLEQFSGLTMPPLCGPDANPNPNPNQGPDGTEGELAGGPSVRLWSHGLLRAGAVSACMGCCGARCRQGRSFDEAAWPRPRPRRDPRRLAAPRRDSRAGWRASARRPPLLPPYPPLAWRVKQASA